MNEPFDIQPRIGSSYRKQAMIPPKHIRNAAATLRVQHSKKDWNGRQTS